MDTEFLAALDNVNGQVSEPLMTMPAFSPPSLSSSQLKQLELLQHLSLYSELLILVCAEKGMGKTFIAKSLFASREAPDQSLMLEADFSFSYLDILHNIAQFLDLADLADDVQGIEQQVLTQCMQITEEDQGSVLLIIDQAEQLSDSVLDNINQLALLAPSALHIMLLAPLGFENKLLALAEPQAPFHMMDIEPLAEDEAEILLLEQFPEKEWEAEQADFIVQQSAGNPGKILYLAQQLLSGLTPPQEAISASKFPVTHAAAIALVAFALIGAYFYQSSTAVVDVEPEAESSVFEATALEAASPKELPLPQVDLTIAPSSEIIESVEEVDFNFPQPVAVKELNTLDSVANEQDLSEPASRNLAVVEPEMKAALLTKPAEPLRPKAAYSKDEQLLMSASDGAFIIQLFGSYSADNAQAFINTNSSKAMQLLKYQAEYTRKPWHVVVAGPFESREVALQKSKELTVKLRNQKPWIRPITAIQSVLKSRD
jgi:DamX protein